MNLRHFSLKPFRGEDNGPARKITGTIGRRANTLSLGYALLGNLPGLSIPAPEIHPTFGGTWEW